MATKTKRITSQTIRENKGRDMSPRWDGAEDWDGDKFTGHFRDAMEYYRLEKSAKELKPKVLEWMKAQEFSMDDIKAFKKTKDNRCNGTMGGIAACLLRGMPEVHEGFNNGKDTAAWLREQIYTVIKEGKDDVDEEAEAAKEEVKAVAPVLNIQERLREAAGKMCEEIDVAIDSWIVDPDAFDPKAFKIANLLRGKGVKAAHARFIKSFYVFGQNELLELAGSDPDEQLREAYKHVSRKNIKKMIEFYESIMTACDQIATEAKALKKPRAKKIVPAEKQVAKLKFKVNDDKLGISSVPAASIVGAQTAVVYNTKTRKLGIYVALNSQGLGVKGASITNFTEKSFQKTLRKPDTQIKEFKEQNTANRVSTWFGKIKATEVKLNGRVNAEVILLKVFK